MAQRKSVSYLTSIRLEVNQTASELCLQAFEIDCATGDIDKLSPEQIRCDDDEIHQAAFKDLVAAHKAMAKSIKNHQLAVKKLKDFF